MSLAGLCTRKRFTEILERPVGAFLPAGDASAHVSAVAASGRGQYGPNVSETKVSFVESHN